jgi:pSer/pThr/pTyr-binding forkhead associated (FHA) protein
LVPFSVATEGEDSDITREKLMQVQLIVADENRSGQAIPINVPSFTIGRAEGCNLRSRSSQVSRHHCTIQVVDGAVMILDLGGENGTFVNGNRITALQALQNGDKLVVGSHSFVVSIDAGAGKPVANSNDFFELTPTATAQSKTDQSDTSAVDPNMATAIIQNAKKPEKEAEVMFEVRLDGQRVSVTKNKLFDLARRGSVLPDDLIVVAGTKVFADSIQGIVFGDKSSAPPPPPRTPLPATPAAPTGSGVQPPPAPAAVADPFDFPNLEGLTDAGHPFENMSSGPVVKAGRRESAFKALWKALDISFSRVYTIEGNDLVIHSIKALYYVIVVGCSLLIFWTFFNFCKESYETGNLLEMLSKHSVALSVTTLGCVMIIVVVRVLIEMLLLAWVEAAKQEQQERKEE